MDSEIANPDQLMTAPLMGPEGKIAVRFRAAGGRPSGPFASLYVESMEISRAEFSVGGWIFSEQARLVTAECRGLESAALGLPRPDLAERFGDNALLSGFKIEGKFSPHLPLRSFTFRFDDGRRVEVSPAGEWRSKLLDRFVRNVGHHYFSWAKPAKRKLGLSGSPPQGGSSKAPPGTCVAKRTLLHAGCGGGEVVLPVFNGFHYLSRLLPRLLSDPEVKRLIIVDDCSTHLMVRKLLDKARDCHPKVCLLRNGANLGFVRSANRGMAETTEDFVLLNTDAAVPRDWVSRLLEPIRRDPTVASVTPFSNAATILSFPFPCRDNGCLDGLDVDLIDRQFRKLRPLWPLPQLPTGVGFCMGIAQAAFQQIGAFDEVYGRGYAEENDWCQRAIAAGFTHVAAPNLYVHHDHGGTFASAEKKALLERNLRVLAQRFPHYHGEVQRHIARDPLAPFRDLAVFGLFSEKAFAPKISLIIDHDRGGGANVFRNQLINAALSRNEAIILLIPGRLGFQLSLRHGRFDYAIEIEDEGELWRILRLPAIDAIEVNSLMFSANPIGLLDNISTLADAGKIPISVYLHDYHPICPSHNLINHLGTFCGVPEFDACRQCLARQSHDDGVAPLGDRETWNEGWKRFFSRVTAIRAFSACSAELLGKVYPEFREKIQVKPHQKPLPPAKRPRISASSELVLGVAGNISPAKGADVVKGLALCGLFRIVVLGDIAGREKLPRHLTLHGPYEVAEMPGLIERYGINMALIPSIWPETYNFVADELMSLEIPLACFNLGAPAERISRYPLGRVLPVSLATDPAELGRCLERWHKSIEQMEAACRSRGSVGEPSKSPKDTASVRLPLPALCGAAAPRQEA